MAKANQRLQTEVAVIGGGPAGLAAACVAAEKGAKVALVDNSPWLGGQIWRGHKAEVAAGPARHWLDRLRQGGVQVVPNATVFAAPAANVLLAESPECVLEVRWQKLVLATGARERFLPFPGWTLPGVIGPGGLLALVKLGWPIAGKRVVVAGSGPLLLAVADGLKRGGARISLVAEQTDMAKVLRFGLGLLRYPGKLAQAVGVKARLLGVPYRCGCWPTKVAGSGRVESVTLSNGSRTWTEPCDYLACGFDLVPNTELVRLLGCDLDDDFVRVNEFQMTSLAGVFCAGELTGVGGADCALVEGQVAGWAAVEARDRARSLFALRAHWHEFRARLRQAFALRPELKQLPSPDTIVCRCEDVRMADLQGHRSWRAAKLHGRCGMGSCQGRTCGAAAQFLFGWEPDSVRPPLFPVRLESLAGDLPHPEPNSSPLPTTTTSTKTL
jgi:NADPH-dependent 2,4-dienoyl-CoA reductase/sulfur reductase-like enzyme